MPRTTPTAVRLRAHVDRLAVEHPPIRLDSVDFTVRAPERFVARFGHVLDYMARVELEVDRNVLELTTMLPEPSGDRPLLLRRRVAAAGDPARPDPRSAAGRARPRDRGLRVPTYVIRAFREAADLAAVRRAAA